MSIKMSVEELKSLNSEIRLNNIRNKELRKRVKELENSITTYLHIKEQNGLKYNGQAIVLEQRSKHTIKKKKEKEEDVRLWLSSLGVNDTDSAYEKLQEVLRGESIEHQQLKFKNLPK
jgi:hypothetical protein